MKKLFVTLIAVFSIIVFTGTAFGESKSVESLNSVNFRAYSICMIEALNPQATNTIGKAFPGLASYQKVQNVVVSCDGERISVVVAGFAGNYFVTGAQSAAKILIDQGMRVVGVADGRVLVLTK